MLYLLEAIREWVEADEALHSPDSYSRNPEEFPDGFDAWHAEQRRRSDRFMAARDELYRLVGKQTLGMAERASRARAEAAEAGTEDQ